LNIILRYGKDFEMKKIVILLCLVWSVFTLFAADSGLGLDFGYYIPSGPKSGVIWGAEIYKAIDERVDLVIVSGNLFLKSETDKKKSFNSTLGGGTTVEATSDVTTGFIPLFFGARVKFLDVNDLTVFGGATIGYGFAWETIKAAKTTALPDGYDDTLGYNGFTWQLNTGASYNLGSNSDIYAKIYYNHANYSREKDISEGKITSKELNLSGVGINIGLRLKV